ncbi:MAG: hypothetical protein RL701_7545 [Pseudomonadota bacterium]|jgi:hypothetical protein
MKTTLNLDERLLMRAKTLAKREGKTLTALIEEALRARLAPKTRAELHTRVILPTVKGTAPPRVDIADRNALYDLLDADTES